MIPPLLIFLLHGIEKISTKVRTETFKILKIFIIGIFMAKTMIRSMDWQNEESLQTSAVKLGSLKSQVNLGSILGEAGKFNTSYFLLKDALRRKPTSDIFYNLALIEQRAQKFASAEMSYKKCLNLRPSHDLCRLNLGVLHENDPNSTDISEYYYQTCLESNLNCRFNLARLCYRRKEYHRTVQLLEKTATVKIASGWSPTYSMREQASFLNLLGLAHLKLQNFETARFYVEKSLETNPKHGPALAAMQILNSIQDL